MVAKMGSNRASRLIAKRIPARHERILIRQTRPRCVSVTSLVLPSNRPYKVYIAPGARALSDHVIQPRDLSEYVGPCESCTTIVDMRRCDNVSCFEHSIPCSVTEQN